MTDLQFDTPAENQTAFAHAMMAAMAEYLDAIAVGSTSIGRAHLGLAEDHARSAIKAAVPGAGEVHPASLMLSMVRSAKLS